MKAENNYRKGEDNYHTRIIMILPELLIVPVGLGDSTSKIFTRKNNAMLHELNSVDNEINNRIVHAY